MKKLKFLRNVLVDAIHREQGSVHEIDDKHVVNLIRDGAAILVEEPETAAAKNPGKETAAKK